MWSGCLARDLHINGGAPLFPIQDARPSSAKQPNSPTQPRPTGGQKVQPFPASRSFRCKYSDLLVYAPQCTWLPSVFAPVITTSSIHQAASICRAFSTPSTSSFYYFYFFPNPYTNTATQPCRVNKRQPPLSQVARHFAPPIYRSASPSTKRRKKVAHIRLFYIYINISRHPALHASVSTRQLLRSPVALLIDPCADKATPRRAANRRITTVYNKDNKDEAKKKKKKSHLCCSIGVDYLYNTICHLRTHTVAAWHVAYLQTSVAQLAPPQVRTQHSTRYSVPCLHSTPQSRPNIQPRSRSRTGNSSDIDGCIYDASTVASTVLHHRLLGQLTHHAHESRLLTAARTRQTRLRIPAS